MTQKCLDRPFKYTSDIQRTVCKTDIPSIPNTFMICSTWSLGTPDNHRRSCALAMTGQKSGTSSTTRRTSARAMITPVEVLSSKSQTVWDDGSRRRAITRNRMVIEFQTSMMDWRPAAVINRKRCIHRMNVVCTYPSTLNILMSPHLSVSVCYGIHPVLPIFLAVL